MYEEMAMVVQPEKGPKICASIEVISAHVQCMKQVYIYFYLLMHIIMNNYNTMLGIRWRRGI